MLISDWKVNMLTCNKRLISEKFISHNADFRRETHIERNKHVTSKHALIWNSVPLSWMLEPWSHAP